MHRLAGILAGVALACLGAVAPAGAQGGSAGVLSVPVTAAALPGWQQDRPAEAWGALLASCAAFAASGAEAWRSFCDEAADLGGVDEPGLRAFLEARLQPIALGTGLLTGYHEPALRGALAPGGAFRTPLRAPPPGLTPGMVLPERAAIEAGALDGAATPILWVDDPVDAFFLQIQGSGRVLLPDGGVLRLGFAGRNGQPYRAIGRLLIERGEIARESMSAQAIRAWLARATPEAATALMRENPSYVFFRILDGLGPEQGPVGTLGQPLTPGRSLAVDPAFVPLGAPVWIVARDPVDGSPIRRLVLAQDTGGAIRGQARGDLFWGWDAEAGHRAGLMQDRAAGFFLLLPRAAPEPGRQPAQPGTAPVAPSTGPGPRLD